jgi:5-methylcytosine-specific restriction endonuclease McrA
MPRKRTVAKKKPAVRKPATEWTEGRKKAFITSLLRSGFRKFPPKSLVLKAAAVGKKINTKTKRVAEHYVCNGCKEHFPQKDVQVDHIDPVVGKEGFVSWDRFIDRLFCPKENLQVLCSECHTEKSRKENEERVKVRHATDNDG